MRLGALVVPATLLPAVPREATPPAVATVDIVDVGHGSCVVVRTPEMVSLIDTGPGGAILEYLLREGVAEIDTIVISHADADHIGGLSAILSQQIPVRAIIWNPDALKTSEIWKDLVYQIADLHNSGATCATQNATQDTRVAVGSGDVEIVILAPGVALQHLGPGATDRNDRHISSNSASVVAQVRAGNVPVALVPGDLDELGLIHIMEAGLRDRLKSHFLVLPHHGGHCGTPSATRRMTSDLVTAVSPDAVFVSNGRGGYGNPRAEVVRLVLDAAPGVKIACTQLSAVCSQLPVARTASPAAYSSGWARGFSCAGTVRVQVGHDYSVSFNGAPHQSFVSSSVPAHLC
ncbi:ComEC/Rec2 family competence protein [Microbacterium trichothecenolyticum]